MWHILILIKVLPRLGTLQSYCLSFVEQDEKYRDQQGGNETE